MENLIRLIESFGYEFDFEDTDQRKRRYSGDYGFIDVWNGKRGITIGIYNPQTSLVNYVRKPDLLHIEEHLVRIKKQSYE